MAVFHYNPCKPVSECLYSGFYWTEKDGCGGEWSYKNVSNMDFVL